MKDIESRGKFFYFLFSLVLWSTRSNTDNLIYPLELILVSFITKLYCYMTCNTWTQLERFLNFKIPYLTYVASVQLVTVQLFYVCRSQKDVLCLYSGFRSSSGCWQLFNSSSGLFMR